VPLTRNDNSISNDLSNSQKLRRRLPLCSTADYSFHCVEITDRSPLRMEMTRCEKEGSKSTKRRTSNKRKTLSGGGEDCTYCMVRSIKYNGSARRAGLKAGDLFLKHIPSAEEGSNNILKSPPASFDYIMGWIRSGVRPLKFYIRRDNININGKENSDPPDKEWRIIVPLAAPPGFLNVSYYIFEKPRSLADIGLKANTSSKNGQCLKTDNVASRR